MKKTRGGDFSFKTSFDIILVFSGKFSTASRIELHRHDAPVSRNSRYWFTVCSPREFSNRDIPCFLAIFCSLTATILTSRNVANFRTIFPLVSFSSNVIHWSIRGEFYDTVFLLNDSYDFYENEDFYKKFYRII